MRTQFLFIHIWMGDGTVTHSQFFFEMEWIRLRSTSRRFISFVWLSRRRERERVWMNEREQEKYEPRNVKWHWQFFHWKSAVALLYTSSYLIKKLLSFFASALLLPLLLLLDRMSLGGQLLLLLRNTSDRVVWRLSILTLVHRMNFICLFISSSVNVPSTELSCAWMLYTWNQIEMNFCGKKNQHTQYKFNSSTNNKKERTSLESSAFALKWIRSWFVEEVQGKIHTQNLWRTTFGMLSNRTRC